MPHTKICCFVLSILAILNRAPWVHGQGQSRLAISLLPPTLFAIAYNKGATEVLPLVLLNLAGSIPPMLKSSQMSIVLLLPSHTSLWMSLLSGIFGGHQPHRMQPLQHCDSRHHWARSRGNANLKTVLQMWETQPPHTVHLYLKPLQ